MRKNSKCDVVLLWSCFVRDSLPEGTDRKVRALEQIRVELDEKYAEQVRQAQKLLDEMGYLSRQMLPERLYVPEDYVSPEEERLAIEQAALRTWSKSKSAKMGLYSRATDEWSL